MARALWKGSIAFGLVQIPVGLYSAEQSDDLDLDWLDKRDLAPVGYERVNKRTGKPVEWSDIVKGYEHAPGDYVILSDQDIAEANAEVSHTLDIDRFVDMSEVDLMYFDRPYYVGPDKSAGKAYALLLETLRKANKAAIAKYVVRTRQHIGLLFPKGDLLVLMQMRYQHELRTPKNLDLPQPAKHSAVTAKERAIAKSLVESMSGDFDPSAYHDEYRDEILALIKERVKAGEVNTVPEAAPHKRFSAPKSNVVDLVALLKQSLAEDKGAMGKRTPKRAPKQTAHKTSRASASAKTKRSRKAHAPLRKSA
jgi:DNA end-binding protein Ku